MCLKQNLQRLLCLIGFACAACIAGCDKVHDQSAGVEGAGSAAPGDHGNGSSAGAAGKSTGDPGAAAGRTGSGSSAGAAGRAATAGRGSQAGAEAGAAGSGKPAGTGGSTSGRGGSAAGSGGAAAGSGGAAAGSGGTPGNGARCGTRGGVPCGADEFCSFEPDADCGGTDRGGVCQQKSEICTDIYKPVCGCDNRTYSSDCNAHGAGLSVKHTEMCNPDECTAAGGRAEYSNGATIPECDAGEVSWNISGGREQVICCLGAVTTGQTCGGIAALECDPDQFCNYEESAGGQGCGDKIADAAGKCEQTPSACTKELREVCGCDRQSYSNRCVAHAAELSVLHDGACTESDCKAIGGRVAYGTGPAAMCNAGETEHGGVVADNGSIFIEGALCCLP